MASIQYIPFFLRNSFNIMIIGFSTFLLMLFTFIHPRKSPPAHYTLKYNLMPYVGALTYGEIARTSEPVPFPESREVS